MKIPVLLLICFLLSSLVLGQMSRTERKHIEAGMTFAQNHEFVKAIAEFDKAIKLNPNNADALFLRGLAKFMSQDLKGAKFDFEKIVKLGPKMKGIEIVYNNLGTIYYFNGEKEKGCMAYEKSIKVNPNYLTPYTGRGNCLNDKGDLDKAFAAYDKALSASSSRSADYTILIPAYIGRGDIYFQKGDLDSALADFDKVLTLDPGDAAANLQRGLIYALKDRWILAISDIRNGIDLHKSQQQKTSLKGNIKVLLGELDDYISRNPKNARGYAVRGLIRLLLDRDIEAEQDFKTTFDLDNALRTELESVIKQIKESKIKP